jgi:hypothetical protein
MQIDGHHGMTYAVARLAGFKAKEAATIAYAAQYVDDATNDGLIQFVSGEMYERIATAHKMLDYRNSVQLADHLVWIPFHFLPGNGGLPPGESPDTLEHKLSTKLICTPDSHIAREMLRAAFTDHKRTRALHRLGVAMHVYADTFAHQGFAGILHPVNAVTDLDSKNHETLLKKTLDKLTGFFVGQTLPIGHGAALSLPDQPTLHWSYTNGTGERRTRDNLAIFKDAAQAMYKVMKCHLAGDLEVNVEKQAPMPARDFDAITSALMSETDPDGEVRHRGWLEKIRGGYFSFGAEQLDYIPKGDGSWKYAALGTLKAKDSGDERYPFNSRFLLSDWKQFHDAVQAHRLAVLHEILPRYGICAC